MQTLKLTKKYATYPEYKDSGVEWLGKIPKGWDLEILQHLFAKVKRVGFEKEELLSVYRDRGVIIKSSRDDNHNKASEDLSTYQLVEVGNLAINKMKAWQGSVAVSPYRGIVSPAYFVYKPLTENSSKFLHYLLRSDIYIKQYERNSGGVRNDQWDLNPERFRKLEVSIPPKEEQTKIANYLDEKTACIDQIIEKKQKLIELLHEKRTAVINHAVTKGLDPKAELVDSGVEWLGKVSKKFKVIDLRYLVNVSTGGKDTANAIDGGEYPFFVRSPHIERINTYSFDGEAVLTAGDGAGVGKVFHHFVGKFDYHQRVYCFSNFKNISGRFFYYYLMSNLKRVVLMGETKSTVDSIRQPQLLNLPIAVPNLDEQLKIVIFLDEKIDSYDDAIKYVEDSIEKLKEFKSSLISHVVTGKIKV